MKDINIENMDRVDALLLYKDKLYIDGNHQFAFQQAMEDDNKKIKYDIDEEIDKVAELTHKLSEENKICTLDLYEDDNCKYLISHFKENLILNLELLKRYAEQNNFKLGYFVDFQGDDCNLIN
ncbi:hypothetical protein [Terrisporobacter sp.]|uniref:hypothetical protein n=1 Tax=Terrisporobacter sp. TaxID=1965305 RepID=UPI0028A28DBE|nr:hypothetical protein [Terrisporobacter sp.]